MPGLANNPWRDETGATAVEYSLMVAAIAAVIVTVVFVLGTHVSGLFDGVTTLWSSQE